METGWITLYIATSVDGFVADDDGGVAWLDVFDDASEDGGFEAFLETVDCLVMGSATYEQVRSLGEWPYADRPTYVLTRRERPLATEDVALVRDQSKTSPPT